MTRVVQPPLAIRFPSPRGLKASVLYQEDSLYGLASFALHHGPSMTEDARARLCFALLEAWPQNKGRAGGPSTTLIAGALSEEGVRPEALAEAFNFSGKKSAATIAARGRRYMQTITLEGPLGVYVPEDAIELAQERYGPNVRLADVRLPGGDDPLFDWAGEMGEALDLPASEALAASAGSFSNTAEAALIEAFDAAWARRRSR